MLAPRHRPLFALLAALLAAPALARAVLVPGDSTRTLTAGGVERSYLLHVPPGYDGQTAVPLVLNFHGLGSNANQQRGISRMLPVSDREGFLLVHPEGLNAAWNAGLCCGSRDVDDVGFVRAVVAAVVAEGNVDASRIYATGLSNGGAITQRLACDAADLFAAAAPMAFPVPFRPLSGCHPVRAIPVLTFMGLTDVLVRYEGTGFPSAVATRDFWRQIDGCSGDTPDETTTVGASRCEVWSHCTGGGRAGLCSITAQSFGGSGIDGHILYLNPDFELAEVAWQFLSQFRLPDAAPVVTASLTGTDRLRLPGVPASVTPLGWRVSLGAGTWFADADDGTTLAGSARRRGRRWVLSLTADARATLLAALGARASAIAGRPLTFTSPAPERLRAVVDARGRVHLLGRLRLGDAHGSSAGVLTLRGSGRRERS